jgi:hypothetical protein
LSVVNPDYARSQNPDRIGGSIQKGPGRESQERPTAYFFFFFFFFFFFA